MSSAVENRSKVLLTALSPLVDGPSPAWKRCRVLVTAAAEVEGYPNLLAAELPRELDALLPAEDAVVLSSEAGPHERLASLVAPHTLRTLAPAQT